MLRYQNKNFKDANWTGWCNLGYSALRRPAYSPIAKTDKTKNIKCFSIWLLFGSSKDHLQKKKWGNKLVPLEWEKYQNVMQLVKDQEIFMLFQKGYLWYRKLKER